MARAMASERANSETLLNTTVVLYVVLWIFEGAVRKWIPSLDGPMYVFRDLIVTTVLLGLFLKRGVPAGTILATVSLVSFGILQSITLNVDVMVITLGLRAMIAPLLLLALLFSAASPLRTDLIPRVVLMVLPLQTLLVIVQVSSDRSSSWNRQTGGEEAYFTTADDIVRAAGTFSAPAGLIAFCGIATVSLLVLWPKWSNPVLKLTSATLLIAMLGLSGSRGAVFICGVLVIAWVLRARASSRPTRLPMLAGVALTASVTIAIIGFLLPNVTGAFQERFVAASSSENTALRILTSAFGYLVTDLQPLGSGLGVHSSSGRAVGSAGEWIEDDSARWVAEMGVLGLWLGVLRSFIGLLLLILATRRRDWTEAQHLTATYLGVLLVAGSVTTNPSTQGAVAIIAVWLASEFKSRNRLKGVDDEDSHQHASVSAEQRRD